MDSPSEIQLINLLGFAVGAVLYGLLFAMTLRHPVRRQARTRFDLLLLITAVLGLSWNAGELVALVARDFGLIKNSPVLSAITHSALGFLPAVIVNFTLQTNSAQSTLRSGRDERFGATRWLIFIAYGLSAVAAALHFANAILDQSSPSATALQILTFGYLTILVVLCLFAFRQTVARKTVLAAALAVFAVSALHLSRPHDDGSSSWIMEAVGHQASLPLVLAILYQDFRFAFADLFLKRALALLFLTLFVFAFYIFAARPLVELHKTHAATDSEPTFILLGFWVVTALCYPKLHDAAVWLVDKILLGRVSEGKLRDELWARIEKIETATAVLDETCYILARALTAQASWQQLPIKPDPATENFDEAGNSFDHNAEHFLITTTEPPFFKIILHHFSGGRKLLSGETEMLEKTAMLAARRIDALRVTHERCAQEIREQEIGKLATEAELRALRAQLNPHFLFNALTTIGYLIDNAPDRALATLLRLTQLLRGVLRSTGEFCSLGDELRLIESYLDIERARFEERLQIEINVPPELLKFRVPTLILQPIVENAVKHGISPQKNGGKISLAARVDGQHLVLQISDTGAGVDQSEFAEKRLRGVGLQNIEARLRSHYGAAATLTFISGRQNGAQAEIKLPLSNAETTVQPLRQTKTVV